MDLVFVPSLPVLVSLFIIPLFIFFSKLLSRSTTNQNLPPGPRKLPVIGNMHNLIGSVSHRVLQELSLKFGAVMHLQLGEISAVIISSPEAAKQVMKTHDIDFASRPSIVISEILSYNCTSISFSPYGDHWRQLRKICTLELLSPKRVQSFRSIREGVCLDLARWLAASEEGSPVNLTKKLETSAYTLISRVTLGKKIDTKDRLLSIVKEAFVLAEGFNIADVYPSIKLLQMMSGLRRRVTELHEEADKIFDEIIHHHRVVAAGNAEQDLVDVLLSFQQNGVLEIPLTDETIKAVILDMLGAGSGTSSSTVDWAMAEMLRNPRIMEKAQDEVRRLFDDNQGYVDESKINELKYFKSIIKETLRFHAPVPLLLPRRCTKKCEIDGYDIPVDTKIIVNAWAIGRDPSYWPNADCFEPERFLDDNLKVDYKGNHFEFIPFGAGRRMCPGMSLGLAGVELTLAVLLYHFDWKLPHGTKHDEMDMTEIFGAAASRAKDLYVVPVIKRPLPTPAK